ncbi:MAG: hypothetical protein J2P18_11490 [Nocardia sp.]|nr:hypothetical protein [Nocardia sp.]
MTTHKFSSHRRMIARIAVAGAVAAAPIAAVAVPAFADAPSAVQIDRHGHDRDHGWDHRGWDHDRGWDHRGWDHPGFPWWHTGSF